MLVLNPGVILSRAISKECGSEPFIVSDEGQVNVFIGHWSVPIDHFSFDRRNDRASPKSDGRNWKL